MRVSVETRRIVLMSLIYLAGIITGYSVAITIRDNHTKPKATTPKATKFPKSTIHTSCSQYAQSMLTPRSL